MGSYDGRGAGGSEADVTLMFLTAAVAAAALVCRLAVLELRNPGTARRALAFTRDRRALSAGLVAALLLAGPGWRAAGPGALAWAVLVGVLVAALSGNGKGPALRARTRGTGPEGSRDQE
ncbi:hypothetical protein [Streptomyces showdoensis]|uniref:hypothetical protein n=1 Tax=Streptomyces showdoensis TaxID=68268 RepID=UPI00196A1C7E|nr:hypothetical protein [Streptomyces showdoensis]